MFDPLARLVEFIRFPSVSADPGKLAGMDQARRFLAGLFHDLGFATEIVQTAKHPIVLAERHGESSWPHVIIYGHYDVQPADPLNLWETPPFEPNVRGGRLYGRGASDNKGPLMANIAAVARVLAQDPKLPLRITFLVEGEEEVGSPSFPSFLDKYRERLNQADFVFLSDTGLGSGRQAIITCGLRGLCALDVHVVGPNQDLHSGLHGGVLRNPIQALAEVCETLHAPDGWINVPGFYGNVVDIEPWEKAELKKLKPDEKEYAKFLGIESFTVPPGFSPYEALRFLPTLEFNGIGGGYQGGGTKTVIPSKAFVKISCRLVPNQQPARIQQGVIDAIQARVPKGVRFEFERHHIASPYVVVPPGRSNTPKNQPPILAKAFQAADRAIVQTWGLPPLYLREGGSIPIIAEIKRAIGLDSLMFGLSLAEDNLHAPNESFDLSVLEEGTVIISQFLKEVAAFKRDAS
jgi:acetylornithine deacetylase/succinyl-diaminopimelate desuccinylase-like protein